MTFMEVIRGKFPPNYFEILKYIPQARRHGVIFAYGDKIYSPNPKSIITKHLYAHECVHGRRQIEIGVEEWWHRYLTDLDFRYNEELLAHRAEFKSMKENGWHWKMASSVTAHRLASSLYGCRGGVEIAKKHIMEQ